jgi:acyl dehydratase
VALDLDLLSGWAFEDRVHRYGVKDTILYALGIGCGDEADDLPFVYEKGLLALPSMATILGDPGFWLQDPRLGADWSRAVHGEQYVRLHASLPVEGTILAQNAIDGLIDKGAGRGVFVLCSRTLFDQNDGRMLAELKSTIILRGDGGDVRSHRRAPASPSVPDRQPDISCSKRTAPQAALIYRLSGDLNPLHVDPETARHAGFPGPILHGLCTMGIATRAILRTCCGDHPSLLTSIGVRFAAPVFPGETIRTEIWRNGAQIQFRCWAAERDTIVLDAGTASVHL